MADLKIDPSKVQPIPPKPPAHIVQGAYIDGEWEVIYSSLYGANMDFYLPVCEPLILVDDTLRNECGRCWGRGIEVWGDEYDAYWKVCNKCQAEGLKVK